MKLMKSLSLIGELLRYEVETMLCLSEFEFHWTPMLVIIVIIKYI